MNAGDFAELVQEVERQRTERLRRERRERLASRLAAAMDLPREEPDSFGSADGQRGQLPETLEGHALTVQSQIVNGYYRMRASCSCGWSPDHVFLSRPGASLAWRHHLRQADASPSDER